MIKIANKIDIKRLKILEKEISFISQPTIHTFLLTVRGIEVTYNGEILQEESKFINKIIKERYISNQKIEKWLYINNIKHI